MDDAEEARIDMMQRMQSSFGTSPSSLPKKPISMNQLDIPQFNTSQIRAPVRQFSSNFSSEAGKRVGMPPSHPQIPPISPYSQIPASRPANQQAFSPGPTHSRSLSQPPFFSLDSLPPLSPSPYRDSPTSSNSGPLSTDVSMEDKDVNSHSMLPPSPFTRSGPSRAGESLPPRKAHRRSNSDIPFGFSGMIQQPSPPFVPVKNPSVPLVKREVSWDKTSENNSDENGEVADDLFSAYMNLDNIDVLNSSGTDEKQSNDNREDSRASGSKKNGCDSSDNEATSSSANVNVEKREGVKRNAVEQIGPASRHHRSLSIDSFMGKMNFGELTPSPGTRPGHLSPANPIDAKTFNGFSLEFGNGEFTGAELKKIMANEKLVEIALNDPKRAKRILANRQSAARSKERKMRYIGELEHKVQTLQSEATTLSAQLTLLQRDSAGLTNQNNELKFRLQSMDQQAQLRDALNEALTAEVQRLKLITAEMSSGGDPTKFQQLLLNPQQQFQVPSRQLKPQTQNPSLQNNNNGATQNESSQP